jgi:hypothetical protein
MVLKDYKLKIKVIAFVRKVQVTWLAELGLANSFIRHFAC